MKTIEKIAGENNGCNRMRLIRTIETDIALLKQRLVSSNLAKTRLINKRLDELQKELETTKHQQYIMNKVGDQHGI